MSDDANERIGAAQTSRRRFHLGFPHVRIVVQKLPLQVVRFDAIEVGDANRPHAGGGQIERGRTAQPARADDEHAAAIQFFLAGTPICSSWM